MIKRIQKIIASRFASRDQRGQLLVESVVAISLIIVGLLGVFALLSQSLGLRRVVNDRYVATYLAAEGIELVKNMIDTNYINDWPWNDNLPLSGEHELAYNDSTLQPYQGRQLNYDPSSGKYSYAFGSPMNIKRKITISCLDGDCNKMRVNSRVDWVTRGGGEFSVNLEDHFYDWRVRNL